MDTLSRKTVNFNPRDSELVGPFLDADSEEHAALERLVGQALSSDSAELRALILLGVRAVRDSLLEDAYNEAVGAGDFEGTREWAAQTAEARRRRRS